MSYVENHNLRTFSSREAVEEYSVSWLRSSERHVIEKYMPPGAAVLDVGCGAGRTTAALAGRGCRTVGIDIAEPLLARARELCTGVEFRRMDVLRLEFPADAFDVVFFSFNGLDNLYPLSHRLRALREMRRVARPGGHVIYSSHNSLAPPRNLTEVIVLLKNLPGLSAGPHWRYERLDYGALYQYCNNVSSETRLLRSVGLRVVEVCANGRLAALPPPFRALIERFPIYVAQK